MEHLSVLYCKNETLALAKGVTLLSGTDLGLIDTVSVMYEINMCIVLIFLTNHLDHGRDKRGNSRDKFTLPTC